MIQRTFGQVKTELARVAGQSGMQATDTRLREMTNLAQERLSVLGEWPYQYARVKFCQTGGIVSLPSEYEALVHTAINSEPVEIQPRWFEFLEFGPGPVKKDGWANLGLDLGESPVSRQPGYDGAKVRVVSTDGTDESTVKIFGYDVDGVQRTADLVLPDATTTIVWSKITRVLKPVTAGDVVLSFKDDFGEYLAASYRPRDTSASFRTYHFTAIAADQTKVVQGIVRRRLLPILDDTDELFITNVGALRLGVKGIALEDKGDLAGSAVAFQLAVQILQEEARLYKAGRSKAPLNVHRTADLSVRPDIY
jgi:hypothetical protein